MDTELNNFIKLWLIAISSLCYSYYLTSRIPTPIFRLLSLLPIFSLFISLPLTLHSFHLGAPSTFYLVWLANFKLLLFAFHDGPLFSSPPLSLPHFISIALLPIKPKHKIKLVNDPDPDSSPKHPLPKNGKNKINAPNGENKVNGPDPSPKPPMFLLAVKVVLLAVIVGLYKYRPYLHPYVILALYCCHLYLGIELVLALTATPVRAVFGFELEPQFNEPYLATSLQDFWGRRWNLMVTSILRPTVYFPVLTAGTHVLGRKEWARPPAVFATFLVSGLMHEVIYFYLTRVGPTWEVTWFFVLQGVCTAAEVVVKKAVAGSRWRLHRAVSGFLTLGFAAVTGAWLFFPQVINNGLDLKAINEYSIFVSFVRQKVQNLVYKY